MTLLVEGVSESLTDNSGQSRISHLRFPLVSAESALVRHRQALSIISQESQAQERDIPETPYVHLDDFLGKRHEKRIRNLGDVSVKVTRPEDGILGVEYFQIDPIMASQTVHVQDPEKFDTHVPQYAERIGDRHRDLVTLDSNGVKTITGEGTLFLTVPMFGEDQKKLKQNQAATVERFVKDANTLSQIDVDKETIAKALLESREGDGIRAVQLEKFGDDTYGALSIEEDCVVGFSPMMGDSNRIGRVLSGNMLLVRKQIGYNQEVEELEPLLLSEGSVFHLPGGFEGEGVNVGEGRFVMDYIYHPSQPQTAR